MPNYFPSLQHQNTRKIRDTNSDNLYVYNTAIQNDNFLIV